MRHKATTTKLLTPAEHTRGKIFGALFLGLLVVVIVVTTLLWGKIGWIYKIILVGVAFFLLPAAGDLKELFRPYDDYQKKWKEIHSSIGKNNK